MEHEMQKIFERLNRQIGKYEYLVNQKSDTQYSATDVLLLLEYINDGQRHKVRVECERERER